MTRRKLLATAGLGVLVLGGGAFALMIAKDQTYVPSAPYAPQGTPNRTVVVVYYSRSGHSEAVARAIAQRFNAPIARIDAEYPRSMAGQAKAMRDAQADVLPTIRVGPVDLAPARDVILVSPTWLFGPATPLRAYVEQADLAGKAVTLVLTGNSRYEQSAIDAFAARVRARGGRLTRHVFLRRGRIFWQKSRAMLLDDVRRAFSAAGGPHALPR